MKVTPWCTGKTAYPTKAMAINRIERQHKAKRRRKDNFPCTLQPYRCETCHLWHVGGTGKSVNKTDAFGRTIRKKHNTLPKERVNGNTERSADESREASLSAMWADAEAQGRPQSEREPRT